ncbi:MAG: hypothetical protein K2R98_17565 [Gemmataceae bacterium]|nr:hypothetical protein [Gemmataceae bacterium]
MLNPFDPIKTAKHQINAVFDMAADLQRSRTMRTTKAFMASNPATPPSPASPAPTAASPYVQRHIDRLVEAAVQKAMADLPQLLRRALQQPGQPPAPGKPAQLLRGETDPTAPPTERDAAAMRKSRLAAHEAAHAVFAELIGVPVDEARIWPDAKVTFKSSVRLTDQRHSAALALIGLAGEAYWCNGYNLSAPAAHRAEQGSVEHDVTRSLQSLKMVCAELGVTRAPCAYMAQELVAELQASLFSDATFKRAFDRVRAALYEKGPLGPLNGDAIFRLVRDSAYEGLAAAQARIRALAEGAVQRAVQLPK